MVDDFLIQENSRIINVCNAPSPAATASLTIGATIVEEFSGPLLEFFEPLNFNRTGMISYFCSNYTIAFIKFPEPIIIYHQ